jgi:hypothetical protein
MANPRKGTTAKKAETPPQSTQAPERNFLIKEGPLGQLVQQIHELPFRVANPMLQFLQQNLQEVAPAKVKEENKDAEG